MRKIIRKSAYLGVLLLVFSGVISCEKDFTDIGTSIIGNSKFITKDTVLEVIITERDIDAVRGDNLSIGNIGEYLLGVYQDAIGDYEKIEASIVSQIAVSSEIDVTDGLTDTTTVTSIFDNAFIKLPYIVTSSTDDDGVASFTLDSLMGSTNVGVNLKVYRNNTFLNSLNPQNPSQGNAYNTDFVYEKGELLNKDADFKFIPSVNDTIYEYFRHYNGGKFKDTLKLTNRSPFLVVPLDSILMKSLFYDKFEDDEFSSQDELNNYFRGVIIEASGNENSLLPFNASGDLVPTLEINYTNTVTQISDGQTDSIKKTASFALLGVKNRVYKMSPEPNPANANQVIIQGAAGKVADVKILQGTQVEDLKLKNWLINDASLTFYIDQDRDTTHIPERLFLYKEETSTVTQIKDVYSEGFDVFSGVLQKTDTNADGINDSNDSYRFRITDYISDILNDDEEAENYNLVLKVYNTTDLPGTTDNTVTDYSWNPRAVTLTNHMPSNGTIEGTRKAQLRIIYSEKLD